MAFLSDWYEDYLRMVQPRAAKDELEFAHGSSSLDELMDGCRYHLSRLHQELSLISGRTDDARECRAVAWSALEWFGALNSAIMFSHRASEESAALIRDFRDTVDANRARLRELFLSEAQHLFTQRIAEFRSFLDQDVFSQGCAQFFDVETEQPVVCAATEPFDSFLSRIQQLPSVVRSIDYWDYLAGLSSRSLILPLLNLTNYYFDICSELQELSQEDERLRSVLCGDHFVLKADKARFFPRAHYWWYYGIPQGTAVTGAPEGVALGDGLFVVATANPKPSPAPTTPTINSSP